MKTAHFLVLIAVIAVSVPAHAWDLVDSTPLETPFDGFNGTGFVPVPAVGQLDSDNIIVEGLSDGDQSWGGTFITGDHARGASTGGETTGGVYAGDDGDTFLMLQPAGSDVTPGAVVVRLTNMTGGTITTLGIRFDVLVYNDQDRANSLNCEFSMDGVSWTGIGPLATTTPEIADASPVVWSRTTMPGASPYGLVTDIPDLSSFYLRWFTDDVSGGGSRDEIGIDNIQVTAVTYPVELQHFTID